MADENLRDRLPKLNAATFSILPHLLANQIVLQNNLIGNLYTVLHQYSHEQGYPDPPPEPEEVIPLWDSSFTPLRKEMEQEFSLLKTGKAVQQPMRLPDKGETLTGLGIRNKVMPGRRVSSNDAVPTITRTNTRPSPNLSSTSENGPPLNLSNKPSYSSLSASKPRIPSSSPHLTPTPGIDHYGRRTSTASHDSSYSNGTNGNGHGDYFTKIRSNGSTAPSPSMSPNPAAGKKKPPPPPPKKIGSFQYVTAMYDFDSHTAGDLSFREGDRIRVVKKTDSSQDWWEGEIGGVKGSFPANYCK
jgi:amphiphysin